MEEKRILKEIVSKRTPQSKEYLMSDGSRRIVRQVAAETSANAVAKAIARSATVSDGLELENYQVENYYEMLNTYPDPQSEYRILSYEYGIVGLAMRAKLAAGHGNVSEIRLRYAVKQGTMNNVRLALYSMNSLEDTNTQSGVYCRDVDVETSVGKKYVSVDIYPYIKDDPTADHYFGIYYGANSSAETITLYGTLSEYPPEIIIDYVPDSGVDYKQSYIEGSAGNAGDYKINAHTGKTVFGKILFALGGERMPMSLGMTYDPYLSDAHVASVLPSGWKFDCEQYVYYDGGKYYYIDGNSERHKFAALENNKYYDTAHTGLILTVSVGVVKITDGHTSELEFSGGRLVKIREKVDKNGSTAVYNETVLTYLSNRLYQITDGMGRTATVSGTGMITVTKPDGNTIAFAPTSDGLTVTDGDESYVYTYTEIAGTKLLASAKTVVSSTETQSLDIEYNGSAKVNKVKEKINGNVVKRYDLSYGVLYTDVAEADYPASDSQITKTVRYSFAENGEALTAFEIKDGRAAAIKIRNSEEYRRYVTNVSSESIEGNTINGETVDITNQTVSRAFGFTDEIPSGVTVDDECLITAQIVRDTAVSDPGDFDMAIRWGDLYSSGIDEWGGSTVHVEDYDGVQIVSVRVSREILNGNPWTGCVFYPPNNRRIKMTISNVRLCLTSGNGEIHCVNVPTGGHTFTEYGAPAVCGAAVCGRAVTGGTVWSELTDCSVKLNNAVVLENVRMTKNDWLLTLEGYARNSNDYIVWYGDLSGATRATSAATFVFDGKETSINKIRFATVTKNNSRKVFAYNSYGSGNNYIVTTKNTVFADKTSKICKEYYDECLNNVRTVDSEGTTTEYTYVNGNVTRVKKYNGALNVISDRAYGAALGENDGSGKYLISETETVLGADHSQTYKYANATGDMTQSTTPSGQPTNYTYLSDGNVSKISATVNSTENKNEFEYEKGRLKRIKHNGFAYDFEYNDYNEVTGVKIGSNYYLTKRYVHSTAGSSSMLEYDINSFAQRDYDIYGRLIRSDRLDESDASGAFCTDIYGGAQDNVSSVTSPTDSRLTRNAESKLRKRIDNGQTMLYNYDRRGNLKKVERKENNSLLITTAYEYDPDDIVTKQTYTAANGIVQTQKTTYKDGDALNSDRPQKTETTIVGKTISTEDTYDGLGRTATVTKKVGSVELKDTYEYCVRSGGNANDSTNRISRIYKSVPGGSSFENYAYDGNGNIKSIVLPEGDIYYRYDGLNRLIREDNTVIGKTYTYTYDAGGNITSRTEYAYTTESNPANGTVINYGYTDNVYKDKLTSYNGQACAYDELGNITGYKGATLTWRYGRLDTFGRNLQTTYYTYDGSNVRRSKNTGARLTTYYYEGSKLLGEIRQEHDWTVPVCYVYDHRGIAGFYASGNLFIYRKNLQGDVTGIYNEAGVLVAEYAYDAYGRCTILKDVDGVATENAIRYRGYYYDAESGLYYLINRYYDPELGRFISCDHIGYMLISGFELNGLNLYAYCFGNPVMYTDTNGTVVSVIALGIFGLLSLFGVFVVYEVETKYHPIETTVKTIGKLTEDFINQLNFENIVETEIEIDNSNILEFNEHSKNSRPSTKGKHEKGQASRQRDRKGGEKGDKRRPENRSNKRRIKNSLFEDIIMILLL